jgi:hypothetical protein
MDARFRPRITYANVTATIALFLVLGGGAYAAFSLPKNSVGTKQLKNGAVTTAKLHNRAVKGSKVANKSLTGSQINSSTLGTVPNAKHATSADKIPGLSFTPITLINGWTAVLGLRAPAYAVDAQGVVHFEGAMHRTSGISNHAFDMPVSLAPAGPPGSNISLTADENNGATGRIAIGSDATVDVNDDPDHSGSGASFTSLEGITYLPGL